MIVVLKTKAQKNLFLNLQAAYKGNTLGLPKICPTENVYKIDRSIILKYLKNHYTPSRMVVAAVGVSNYNENMFSLLYFLSNLLIIPYR